MPLTWKRSTLCSIITRAHRICSTQKYLEAELLKIKHEFTQINGYPKRMFDKINEECKLALILTSLPTIKVTSTMT